MTEAVNPVGTVLVCPGQGSQHAGMLDGVPEPSAIGRLIDAAEALADTDLHFLDKLGSEKDLADTRVAQPLLYLSDWAWGSALLVAGMRPIALAGHSLGEFAALALADVFSVEAGLHLVVERASLMATAAVVHPGVMAAVLGLDVSDASAAIDGIDGVWIANDNCPGQVVVSGTKDGVEAASIALETAGARRVVPLSVSGGFHSPLMEDAARAFQETLIAADFADASIPVVQNTAPEAPLTDGATIRRNLSMQMTSPVRWTETMTTLREAGAELLVEAGPGKVLTGLARRVDGLRGLPAEEIGVDIVMEEVSA